MYFIQLTNVEDYDRDSFPAPLAENEVVKDLPYIGYDGGIKRIVLAVKFRFTFHTSEFYMRRFLTHY